MTMTVEPRLNLDKSFAIADQIGDVTIRVVVLPKKANASGSDDGEEAPLDLEEGEFFEAGGSNPLASYLEASKGGRRCIVFLVNGQRQDHLDNSFIVQELGFKYLRNRMMIVVDVDALSPESMGELMQGSRQSFFKGAVWAAIYRRIVATLKADPDLERLEAEAEEQVAELRAGDEKVKEALDQLIEDHHDEGLHLVTGAVAAGDGQNDDTFGFKTVKRDGVVSLVPPDQGKAADFPVLTVKPDAQSIRLKPDEARKVTVRSLPSSAWTALAAFSVEAGPTLPELSIKIERSEDRAAITLKFVEPKGFDREQYPIRTTVTVTARFNGIREPRRTQFDLFIKPDREIEDPVLVDVPTSLRVSSRQPIPIKKGSADTHVRLKWDGHARLLMGDNPPWALTARELTQPENQPRMTFSSPSMGRFTLLVTPQADWEIGRKLRFTVEARGPEGKRLDAAFDAEVIAEPAKSEPKKREPRLVDAPVALGGNRRPPYVLRYITEPEWADTPCWDDQNWTANDPGYFSPPNAREPLTLIVNQDMQLLKEYSKRIADKSKAESEVERRVNKYTSHIAFHLYQMYQATIGVDKTTDDESRQRAEIQRVAGTLIKLMEIAR